MHDFFILVFGLIFVIVMLEEETGEENYNRKPFFDGNNMMTPWLLVLLFFVFLR